LKWQRGDEIGGGGFCTVYECSRVDESDGEQRLEPGYAFKILKEEHAVDPKIVARFQREVRMLAELDHDNVVTVHGRNLSADPPWFVMPRADSPLDKVIPAGGADEDWAASILEQLLEGVAHAHARDMIHRDLKPHNVLVFGEVVQVADFGLGKRLAGNTEIITTTYANLVTYAYSAPEQFNNMRDVDARADVFALGKTLVHILTGKVPAPGPTDGSDVSERFRYFVSRCCANNPDDRYNDADAALVALRRIIAAKHGVEQDPAVALAALTESWWEAAEEHRLDVIDQIHGHLLTNAADEPLFVDEVPRLPKQLLEDYQNHRPHDFRAMVEVYDGHVSGGLPWDYCDVVASLYRRIWDRTDDPLLRRLILARLLSVAHSHNRFFVGDVAAGLLASIDDDGLTAMALEVLDESPGDAAWLAGHIGPDGVRNLPSRIRNALDP
jgi:serine/threonine protein kinase